MQSPRRRGFSAIGATPIVEPPARRQVAKDGSAPVANADAVAPPITGVPGVLAERTLSDMPAVSVICPTYNRPAFHGELYDIFRKQDYPAKDLWILDDTHAPSAFFSKIKDPDVHYVHRAQKQTIGAKRNQLIFLSGGAILAHFDDDDYYAPNYLSSMVEALLRSDADFVKLASWRELRQADGHRRLFDALHQKHANMWGWGFSFMYRRYVATLVRFPNLNNGEDYAFVQGLHARGLKTVQVEGGSEWIEHRLHGRNVSRKE